MICLVVLLIFFFRYIHTTPNTNLYEWASPNTILQGVGVSRGPYLLPTCIYALLRTIHRCIKFGYASKTIQQGKRMPEALLGSLTLDDLSKLRKFTQTEASIFLLDHELNPDELERAQALIGRDLGPGRTSILPEFDYKPSTKYDPSRRFWIATAWLLGASWRQLASGYGITPQTTMNIASRILPVQTRQGIRLSKELSLEKLSTYFRKFTDNTHELLGLTPLQAAQWLLDHTDLDQDF